MAPRLDQMKILYIKTSIFDINSVQKDSEDVSAGIVFFLNPVHKKLVKNLMLNVARSTLTSPGTIRVNTQTVTVY